MGRRWRRKFFRVWIVFIFAIISYLLISSWKEDEVASVHGLHKIRILRRLNSIATNPHSTRKSSRQSSPLIWYAWTEPPVCGNSIDVLRSHSQFPLVPTFSNKINNLAVVNSQDDNFGQRIVGLIKPPLDGYYQFAIESIGSSELWLGEDEKKATLIANIASNSCCKNKHWWRSLPWTAPNTQSRPVSSSIYLMKSRKYYIEVLHVSGSKIGTSVKVGWRLPNHEKSSSFYVITHHFLYPYHANVSSSNSIRTNQPLQSDHHHQFVVMKPIHDLRSDFYKYNNLDFSYVTKAISNCSYSPSYLLHSKVGYYGSVFHVRQISVYPDDQTALYNGRDFVRGNDLLDKSIAMLIVKKFMKAINSKLPDSFILHNVVSVERNHDSRNGDRYFLNLLLRKSNHSPLYRVSTYVYQPIGQHALCLPGGLRWKNHVHVTVIISVKNQGYWLKKFIENMSKLYVTTKDPNFSVVIVDFNSTDIDIDGLLKRSSLKRYKIIRKVGHFSRALGLQMGADSVTNRHSIVLLMDLHLSIPNNFIDNVRRRTVERRTTFVPYFLRLNCNYSPSRPNGYWEDQSYGIVGIYKSDFDRIGGMNTKIYKYKWGGEDWELLSRILSHGLEVERFRYPQFFHYFHRRRGTFYKGTVHDRGTVLYYLNIIWQKFIFRRYGKE